MMFHQLIPIMFKLEAAWEELLGGMITVGFVLYFIFKNAIVILTEQYDFTFSIQTKITPVLPKRGSLIFFKLQGLEVHLLHF